MINGLLADDDMTPCILFGRPNRVVRISLVASLNRSLFVQYETERTRFHRFGEKTEGADASARWSIKNGEGGGNRGQQKRLRTKQETSKLNRNQHMYLKQSREKPNF